MESAPDPAAEWLARWQATGDREALEALLRLEVQILRERVRRDGHKLLSSSFSASDVAQEALYRLLARSGDASFPDPASLRAYLWQAAWRLLIDRLRRRGRKVLVPDLAPLVDERLHESARMREAEAEDQRTALLVALNLLSESDQQILELVYFEGRTIEAAAEKLGITRGAANMRIGRARRSLAQKLGGWADLIG